MRNIYSCFLFQILTEEVELYKSIKSIIKTTLQYYIYIYILFQYKTIIVGYYWDPKRFVEEVASLP